VVGKLKKSSGTKLLFWNTSVSRGQSERERERERERAEASRQSWLSSQAGDPGVEGRTRTENRISDHATSRMISLWGKNGF
jgi:hypothetical protein